MGTCSGKLQLGELLIVLKTGHCMPEGGHHAMVYKQGIGQQLLKVGPVYRGVRCTISRFKGWAQAQEPQHLATLRVTHLQTGRECGHMF